MMDKVNHENLQRNFIWGFSFLAAPSTMAIILSRKLLSGSLVILITIQSERTSRSSGDRAPCSPGFPWTTGADSPVMALSSTEAAPSFTFTVTGYLFGPDDYDIPARALL